MLGRILVPVDLIKFSDIKREIVLASSVNRIEIWDKQLYEEILNESKHRFLALLQKM